MNLELDWNKITLKLNPFICPLLRKKPVLVRNVDVAYARLAFLRKYGRPGIKIDRVEAEGWAKQANELGPAAVEWLAMADEQDFASASYCYGVCFHDGYSGLM